MLGKCDESVVLGKWDESVLLGKWDGVFVSQVTQHKKFYQLQNCIDVLLTSCCGIGF